MEDGEFGSSNRSTGKWVLTGEATGEGWGVWRYGTSPPVNERERQRYDGVGAPGNVGSGYQKGVTSGREEQVAQEIPERPVEENTLGIVPCTPRLSQRNCTQRK